MHRLVLTVLFIFCCTLLSAGAAEPPQFKPMSFSGSVLRDGFPTGFGLLQREIAVDRINWKVKPPKDLANKKAEFDEITYGFGFHRNFYYRGYQSENIIEGNTRRWITKAKEHNFGWRFNADPEGNHAACLELGQRTITPGPIYVKATGIPDVRFTKEGTIDVVRIVRSFSKGSNGSIHFLGGFSRAKYANLQFNSRFAGFGLDRMIDKRLDWQNSLVFIDSDKRPKNSYLSSRLNLRLAKGFNISLSGGMYTKGYTYAPFHFADHFLPAQAVGINRLPSEYKKFETKAFGFWGIGIHWGCAF